MMILNIIQNATLSRRDFIKAEVDKMNQVQMMLKKTGQKNQSATCGTTSSSPHKWECVLHYDSIKHLPRSK